MTSSRLSKGKPPAATPQRVPKSTGILTGVLQSRRVPLRGPLTERTAACCINRMLILAADNRRQPIIIDVESPSGSIREALAIIRTMNGVACPVATFSRGEVGAAAMMIAAHGVKGFRVAHSSTEFTIPPGFGRSERASTNGEDEKVRHSFIQLLAHDTGRSVDDVAAWLEDGLVLPADGAHNGGIIDSIGLKPLFPAAIGA